MSLLFRSAIIPKLFEDAYFRTPERYMIKAPPFINGYSLKKEETKDMICSDVPEGLVYKRFMLRY